MSFAEGWLPTQQRSLVQGSASEISGRERVRCPVKDEPLNFPGHKFCGERCAWIAKVNETLWYFRGCSMLESRAESDRFC